MNDILDLKFWAGTEESFGVYLLCLKKMIDSGDFQAGGLAWGPGRDDDDDEEAVPRLFSLSGDIGIIKIAGPLNNSDSPLNRWYGMTGYPEIREALVYAAKRPEVGAIALDVHSGGGAVAGVFDTANLIATIDKKVKPVHAFSGGGVMSAAYLLASAARGVHIDKMAEAGGIGVVSVHQEMSKMLKEIGITPTVIRSGKYKALGNPFEPLSELAKEEMQAQLDQLYGVFVQHVADHRNASYATVDQKMAQGRVFIGERAKEVGLVDSITSFDALMSKVQGGIDSSKERSKYGADSTNKNNKGILMPKQALTEQDIAALELGAGVEASADAGTGAELTEEQKAAAQAAADKEAADKAAAEKEAAEKAAAETAAAAKPAEPSALQLVQSQLAESQAKVTELTIELRDERAKHEAVKGSHASMRAIAVASVQKLKIALQQTVGGEEALDDTALLAQHEALSKTFKDKFKVGGVAAVADDGSDKKGVNEPVDLARHQARIKATV